MKNIKRIFYICTLIAACASGLSAQVTAILTQPKGCENNGMIELEIEGDGPFTIDWTTLESSGGFSPHPVEVAHEEWNNQTKIGDLPPGQYCVTVKNAKCCEAKQCFWLEKEGGNLKVAYKKNVSSCSGKPAPAADGEIYIEIPPKYQESDYDFKWTYKDYPNWVISTKKDLVGVQAETYVLTAYNKITGCEEILEVKLCCCPSFDEDGKLVILSNDELKNACDITANNMTVDAKATPPTGKGATNGSIVLTIKGAGSDPIYYRWRSSTGKEYFTKDIKNLPSGDYCYTVTNGCQTIKDCVPIYVCEEKPLKVTATLVKPCDEYMTVSPKNASGTIELVVTGGATPYKYIWNNGSTSPKNGNLKTGTYTVTITDKGGCTLAQTYILDKGLIIKEASSDPCGYNIFCENKKRPVFFENAKINIFVDDFDCRKLNIVCSATKKTLDVVNNPNPGLSKEEISDNCIVTAQCPNGVTVVTGFDSFNSTLLTGSDPSCSCVKCLRVDYCTRFGDVTKVIRKINIQPQKGKIFVAQNCASGCAQEVLCDGQFVDAFCVTCATGKDPDKFKIKYETNMTIGDLFKAQFSNKDAIFTEEDRLLFPEGVNAYTTLSEFEKISEDVEKRIKENPVSFDVLDLRDYTPTQCEKLDCHYSLVDNLGNDVLEKKVKDVTKISEINVYPNPTDGLLNIEIPYKQYPKSSIKLINALGQVVYKKDCTEESSIKIDMSQLTNGAYNVLINDCNNATIFTKVIVKD